MIRKKVWRYYCEFCKKSGGSGGHIKKHELHCTLNPDRKCGMCNLAGEDPEKIDVLLSILPDPKKYKMPDGFGFFEWPGLAKEVEEVMPELREKTQGCPVCIMAALRQKGISVPMITTFDYKEESEIWLSEANEQSMSDQYY